MGYTEQTAIQELRQRVENASIEQGLRAVATAFPNKVVFSSSFSMEDQIITHIIAENRLPIGIFTLDTGRLFPETYSVWQATHKRYATTIRAYLPNHEQLEALLDTQGPNAFYHSVQNRHSCCFVRKVEPLRRALREQAVWVTGMRAEHSLGRQQLPAVEWDEAHNIIKYHPVLHWTTEEVCQYIRDNTIPYNTLHDKGFASIGCAPCTRAIQPGENMRAGRWWWEQDEKKECGLHIQQENNLQELRTRA